MPSLTTETVPQDFTCFNVSDIFSQPSDNGFQNVTGDTPEPNNNTDYGPRNGDWQLLNLEAYDSKANYSFVWHQQRSVSIDSSQSEDKPSYVLRTYPSEDCQEVSSSDDPWYQSSCLTRALGQCNEVPYSVKSVGISKLNGDCVLWDTHDDAAGRYSRVSKLGLLAVGVVAYVLVQ